MTFNRAGVQSLITDGWQLHRAGAKGHHEMEGGHTPFVVLKNGPSRNVVRCTWEAMRWAQQQIAKAQRRAGQAAKPGRIPSLTE